VTVDQVLANTGFELIVPEQVPVTQPPSAEQLAILRTRIDVKGALRT
jgi:glutaconate CoA-transferase subunit B